MVQLNRGVGRPLFNNLNEKTVVAKLEEAFAIGATATEACVYADISRDALYRYLRKNPEFRNRIKLLRRIPILLAKKTVVDGIQKDCRLAFKFLESKCPEEFAPNTSKFFQYWLRHKESR